MAYKFMCLLLCASVLFSCQSGESNKQTATTQPETQTTPPASIRCFEYITQADSIVLKMIPAGDTISGMLLYKLAGKDSNKGTILGIMRDSILVANYSFISEGITSQRQVAFKFENNSVVEGFGDIETQNDIVRFKDPASLKFDGSIRLQEVPCK